MTMGERIKELRESRGLTQAQLGDIVGKTDKAVSTWENNAYKPRTTVIEELALYFNCSVDYLLGKSDTRVDDNLLDIVNTIPNNALEECGNVLDAIKKLYAESTPDERELILIYRDLNDIGQTALIGTARGLAANPDMKKASKSSEETTA